MTYGGEFNNRASCLVYVLVPVAQSAQAVRFFPGDVFAVMS